MRILSVIMIGVGVGVNVGLAVYFGLTGSYAASAISTAGVASCLLILSIAK